MSVKVIVLGAGVIGVTTAYYLARAGAEVRVLDRQPGPGMETSFANAGELSYGMTSPWAAPGIPMKAVKWLFMRHRPLFIWPMVDPAMWAWGLKMLANCNESAYRLNKGRMVRISNYSRDAMTDLLGEVELDFDLRQQGTLQLFRTEKQLKGSKADQEVLAEFGSPFEVLDRDGCIAAEPGLAPAELRPEGLDPHLALVEEEVDPAVALSGDAGGVARPRHPVDQAQGHPGAALDRDRVAPGAQGLHVDAGGLALARLVRSQVPNFSRSHLAPPPAAACLTPGRDPDAPTHSHGRLGRQARHTGGILGY